MCARETKSQKTETEVEDYHPIIQKVLRYREEFPEASTYTVNSEKEAQELLIAMAATLTKASEAIGLPSEKATVLQEARKYEQAVMDGKGLDLLRSMTDKDQLELFGLRIVATRLDLTST